MTKGPRVPFTELRPCDSFHPSHDPFDGSTTFSSRGGDLCCRRLCTHVPSTRYSVRLQGTGHPSTMWSVPVPKDPRLSLPGLLTVRRRVPPCPSARTWSGYRGNGTDVYSTRQGGLPRPTVDPTWGEGDPLKTSPPHRKGTTVVGTRTYDPRTINVSTWGPPPSPDSPRVCGRMSLVCVRCVERNKFH